MGCRTPLVPVLVVLGGCVAAQDNPSPETSGSVGTTAAETSATSTGDPYAGACDERPTVVGDPQTIGITGVSAMEVIAEVEGIYTGSISFMDNTPAGYIGPTAASPSTIEIRYDGGEIRSVDAVLVSPCEHDGPCPCEDSFEIDVTWRVVSMDGVLDESWVAPVKHQPTSFHMSADIGISYEFQPDDTSGTMSAASFDLDDGFVLLGLVARAELISGAVQGDISTSVEMLGGVGYGPVATFAGVREVTDAACNALGDAAACEGSGCTAVTGQRVSGTQPPCGCQAPVNFCFAAPLIGESVPTTYTRPWTNAQETVDEVVWLPTLVDPPPEPWRLCSDAPEVVQCACTDVCEG